MSATNGWTKSVERLLKNWSQQISINEDEYRKRGTYYRAWYYAFGVFIVVAQTGALTTLINVIISITQDKCKPSDVNLGLLAFVAGMEALILIAQGIDKFFNFGSGSEQFYEAAKDHNALSRLIDATLTLPRIDRDRAREVLLSIRQQFNQIQDNSPNLPPNAIVHRLDMYIYENPSQAKGQGDRVLQVGVQGMEEDTDGSPPVPEDVVVVDLPESPSEGPSCDSDEEHVSIAQQCKFGVQIQEQKGEATREQHRNRALRNLEYQWRRMEQHAEEEQNSSDTSSQDTSQDPEDMV